MKFRIWGVSLWDVRICMGLWSLYLEFCKNARRRHWFWKIWSRYMLDFTLTFQSSDNNSKTQSSKFSLAFANFENTPHQASPKKPSTSSNALTTKTSTSSFTKNSQTPNFSDSSNSTKSSMASKKPKIKNSYSKSNSHSSKHFTSQSSSLTQLQLFENEFSKFLKFHNLTKIKIWSQNLNFGLQIFSLIIYECKLCSRWLRWLKLELVLRNTFIFQNPIVFCIWSFQR